MDEMEIIELTPAEEEAIEEIEGNDGMPTAMAMAIGAGLALAGTWVAKQAKKLWEKHKNAKALGSGEPEEEVAVIEITDDEELDK